MRSWRTVVRISNKAMAPALQLPVEFVEHEVTQQWRKGPPCGVPSTLGLISPFSITPAFKNARMSVNSPRRAPKLTHPGHIAAAAKALMGKALSSPPAAGGGVTLSLQKLPFG